MTQKIKHYPKDRDMERELQAIYSSKLESRCYDDSGTKSIEPYQFIQTGVIQFSATGSATVTKIANIKEANDKSLYVEANVRSLLVEAVVIDVTSTAVTITCQGLAGAVFSTSIGASGGQVLVNYIVIGTNP